jgi:hypothetical protein
MPPTKSNGEARHLLQKMILFAGGEVASPHQWLWETDRWKELVFSLLTRVTALPQGAVRVAADQLQQLGLIDISTLASLPKVGRGSRVVRNAHSRRIVELLEENGFPSDDALRGLTTICEATRSLRTHHNAKIQLCLRSYGEKMLREMKKTFRFSGLNETETNYALRLWLQNVLNMPIPLQDSALKPFARTLGLTGKQILEAADEMDLNVALVDDLLHMFHATSEVTRQESNSNTTDAS